MTEVILADRFLIRGGTAANLATVNESPKARELEIETDTGKAKLGNGSTAYNSLSYLWVSPAGDTMIGDLVINRSGTAGGLKLTSTAGIVSDVRWQSAGVDRWIARKNGDAESTGNAGSNFEFQARADDGSLVGIAYSINRATRVFDFKVAPTVNGVAIGSGSTPTGTGFRHVTSGVEDGAAVGELGTTGSVVRSATPSAGQLLVGNAGGTAYAPVSASGDATVASTGAVTIANDAVTYAKMQNISAASKLLGRGSASGSGDTQEITIGSGLTMSGTTLTASGGVGGVGMTLLGTATVSGSAATTVAISGLDLSAYKAFFITFQLDNAGASSPDIALYYNSDTTAANYSRQNVSANGATLLSGRSNSALFETLVASETSTGHMWIINDRDGRPRCNYHVSRSAVSSIALLSGEHGWSSATNVTGITMSASVANSLAIGSTFSVWGVS